MVPKIVMYAKIATLIGDGEDAPPIIGLAAGNRPVTVDLEADFPHVLATGAAGGGKTVLLRTVMSQALAAGGLGVIFDLKRISHIWADGLPNCEYHRTVESIHDRLLALREEAAYRASERGAADDAPRIWVLAEDLAPLVNGLNKYWRETKPRGAPDVSPAVVALVDLLSRGADQRRCQHGAGSIAPIKMHVLVAAQRIPPEGWQDYATRCLGWGSSNVRRVLCPDVGPIPNRSRQVGRWHIVTTAGTVTETQVAFFSPREARALAGCGGRIPASPEPAARLHVLTRVRAMFGKSERRRAGYSGSAALRRLTGGGSR